MGLRGNLTARIDQSLEFTRQTGGVGPPAKKAAPASVEPFDVG
ncbi:hypothetical protein ACVWXQ_000738 [Bradyrhizobium sp. S3.14.4]